MQDMDYPMAKPIPMDQPVRGKLLYIHDGVLFTNKLDLHNVCGFQSGGILVNHGGINWWAVHFRLCLFLISASCMEGIVAGTGYCTLGVI